MNLLILLVSVLTATVSSYNSAQLSGEVSSEMSVSWTNTSGSKGAVRKGDTATLVISHMPAGTITRIQAYLKSNTASGAATLMLNLPQANTVVLSGNYNTWPGTNQSYSTTYLPIPVLTSSQTVGYNASIILTIIGMTNSVNLEKVVVSYTTAPPVAHSVQLNYQTPAGSRWILSSETAAGSGICLPQMSETTYPGWRHIGWGYTALNQVEDMDLTPGLQLYDYAPLDTLYPASDTALYAVYAMEHPAYHLSQATDYTDGEYVLALAHEDHWLMLSSGVRDHAMHTQPIVLTDSDGIYRWSTQVVADSLRYVLHFTDDSVTVIHQASQTGVGYSSKKLAANTTPWLYAEHEHHTVELYTPDQAVSGTYLLWLDYMADPVLAAMTLANRSTIAQAWVLMEVSEVPEEPQMMVWTSYPYPWTDLEPVENETRYPSCEKYLDHGRMVIRCYDRWFDMQGRLLK